MGHFNMYKDSSKKHEYRWRFLADNNKIIAVSSESYATRRNCEHSIELIKEQAAKATVVDSTEKKD